MADETHHSGDGGFAHVSSSSDRADAYVGDSGSSTHCHMYADAKTGESGIVHRGGCDQCRISSDSGK
jgi:hypothetical protein